MTTPFVFFQGYTSEPWQMMMADLAGWGEMCVRRPPLRALNPRVPGMLDNGAFLDFKKGKPTDVGAFFRSVGAWDALGVLPVAVIAPDEVAGGMRSLALSYAHRDHLMQWGPMVLLAVQDGMSLEVIEKALEDFDGLFVGGTTWWKFTNAQWCAALAERVGKVCHIGRVGTEGRIILSRAVRATSGDSVAPNVSKKNRFRIERAMRAEIHLPDGAIKALARRLAGFGRPQEAQQLPLL